MRFKVLMPFMRYRFLLRDVHRRTTLHCLCIGGHARPAHAGCPFRHELVEHGPGLSFRLALVGVFVVVLDVVVIGRHYLFDVMFNSYMYFLSV